MMPSALEGVRVLDLGHGIAAPLAARILGDFGADVVKVEPAGAGDPARQLAPRLILYIQYGKNEYNKLN